MFRIDWNKTNGDSGKITLDGRDPFLTYESARDWFRAQKSFKDFGIWKHENNCTPEETESSVDYRNVEGIESYVEYLFNTENTYEIINLDEDEEYQDALVIKNRLAEYPTIQEICEAIIEEKQGRPEKMNECVAKNAAVKLKYPKRVN
jgi:hypothetical protein